MKKKTKRILQLFGILTIMFTFVGCGAAPVNVQDAIVEEVVDQAKNTTISAKNFTVRIDEVASLNETKVIELSEAKAWKISDNSNIPLKIDLTGIRESRGNYPITLTTSTGVEHKITLVVNDDIVVGTTKPAGLLDYIVYPIAMAIQVIMDATGNGAIGIIAATLVIVLLVSPLEIKSQVESKKQQIIQPQLTALAEKYPDSKTDKIQGQKYSIEMQRIYDENGMSMMGMCLPMLVMMAIQLPLLTAMMAAVRRLVSLRESSFALFNTTYVYGKIDPGLPALGDFGANIRIFIFATILALLASSVVSLPKEQRNPFKKGAQNQTGMSMYMMQAMFAFMLWNQPIGLAIYWIVSNVARTIMRLTIVNKLVDKQHEKFVEDKRKERMKKL